MAELCEAFVLIAQMAESLGVRPLNEHEGCWEFKIDDHWTIAVNGHGKPMVSSLNPEPIDPFHCYVQFNGWPAGVLNPYGGAIAAGSVANEDTFIKAIRNRMRTT